MTTAQHIDCREHGLQCKKIQDNADDIVELKQDVIRIWEHIDAKISIKVLLAIMSSLVALFLGLFGFSVQMNRVALDDFSVMAQERKAHIQLLFTRQGEVKESIARLEAEVGYLRGEVSNLNSELKEVKRP